MFHAARSRSLVILISLEGYAVERTGNVAGRRKARTESAADTDLHLRLMKARLHNTNPLLYSESRCLGAGRRIGRSAVTLGDRW